MAGVCERKPRARQLQHMREECPYRIVPCPSEGCDADGLKQHLVAEHMQEECLFRMISCSEGCGAQMQRRDLPEHLQTACSAAHIACPYAQFGCGEQKVRVRYLVSYAMSSPLASSLAYILRGMLPLLCCAVRADCAGRCRDQRCTSISERQRSSMCS